MNARILAKLKERSQTLRGLRAELQAAHADLETHYQHAQEAVADARRARMKLDALKTIHEMRIKASTVIQDEQAKIIRELRAEIAAADVVSRNLRAERARLEADLSNLRDRLAEHRRTIDTTTRTDAAPAA